MATGIGGTRTDVPWDQVSKEHATPRKRAGRLERCRSNCLEWPEASHHITGFRQELAGCHQSHSEKVCFPQRTERRSGKDATAKAVDRPRERLPGHENSPTRQLWLGLKQEFGNLQSEAHGGSGGWGGWGG